jgi:predicted ATPase
VSEWFAEHLGGWRLTVVATGDIFSLVLQHPDVPGVDINLADVGIGVSQILPIVVQRLMLPDTEYSSHLEIIEQPELHLHPAAHSAVAELYIAAAHAGSRMIVETHSEVFLLRVRRAVAEGRLNPDDVAVYWIRDFPAQSPRIMPIRIQADGSVDQWPTGVFSEDFEEVRAIQRATKGKRG